MNSYVENLLAPLSPGNPTGPDMSDSPEMFRIDDIARGTPGDEVKGTVAEPPDWRKLRKECEGFLSRSKHLKVAVILTSCLLKQKGLEGFRDGLEVLLGYVRDYWETFHPLLDPGDDNDPTQRLNLLTTIKKSRWPTEYLLAMNHLFEVPLGGTDGRFVTLAVVEVSRGRTSAVEGGPTPMDSGTLAATMRSTPPEQLTATKALLEEILGLVDQLDQQLTSRVGSAKAENFGDLRDTLQNMESVIAPYLQTEGADDAATQEETSESGNTEDGSSGETSARSGGPRAEGGTGVIRSREDVIKQLGVIIDFLTRTEPSSPVIFVLRRAQRMVGMDFLQVISELALGGTDVRETLKPAMGIGLPDPEAAPGGESTTTS
jgi:type VI secretion system protein ImpA